MAEAPIAAMKAVAERLGGLGLDYALLGGSVVGLLLDHPELSPVRSTDDVDVVIEVVSRARYAAIEQKLRALKFSPCRHPDAALAKGETVSPRQEILATRLAPLGHLMSSDL